MSSNYEVKNQSNEAYDIYKLVLSNKKDAIFFSRKDSAVFVETVVAFNIDNVRKFKRNQIIMYFNDVSEKQDFEDLMVAYGREVYKNGIDITMINFRFIVDNKDEEKIVNDFLSKYKLRGDIIYSEKYSQLTENLEDAINNIAAKGKENQVVKEDNGVINKYVVSDDKIYSDNDTLSIAEKKKEALSEIKIDDNMTSEEISDKLLEKATSNQKVHYMENSKNRELDSDFKQVSNDISKKEDGLVNDEIGIIRNNPSSNNKFTAVSRDGDNLRVTNPYVSSTTVSNSESSIDEVTGVDSSFWGEDNDLESLSVVSDSKKEELPVFYIGSSGEIYNQFEKIVGRNGVDGYMVDENNNLQRYSKVIGQIGDINEMSKNASLERSKARVYKPSKRPNYGKKKKSSGIVSLPIIIFIISLFLLIVSGVILYFMK